jgi:hypothetical protein
MQYNHVDWGIRKKPYPFLKAAVVPYLLSKGYKVLFKGRQTCLIKI